MAQECRVCSRMKQHPLHRDNEWCILKQHSGATSRKTQRNGEGRVLCKHLKEEMSGATGLGLLNVLWIHDVSCKDIVRTS